MDRGAWQATVYGDAKSRTQLSNFHFSHFSNILAWRTPWTEEPGGLQSMGSQRVEYDLSNEHFQAYNLAWVLLFLARVELWTFITYWHLLCLFFLFFLYKIDMAFLLLLTTKFKDYALNPLGRSIREITVFVMQIL